MIWNKIHRNCPNTFYKFLEYNHVKHGKPTPSIMYKTYSNTNKDLEFEYYSPKKSVVKEYLITQNKEWNGNSNRLFNIFVKLENN